MATNCSDEFPSTKVFYSEIGKDASTIIFISLASIITLTSVLLFIEALVFLQKLHYGNEIRMRKLGTILGLFPVTIITAFISVTVPRSTFLLDLIASCYLTVCYYTFVTLIIDYFGDDDGFIQHLNLEKISISTPPCCCCCCCLLRPVELTKRSLQLFKLMALQVAVIRPGLLFVAAVLWADGQYDQKLGSPGYLTVTVITTISTLFSLYGTIIIVRAAGPHLAQYRIGMKFMSFQGLLILVNIQNLIFSTLARYDIPDCIGSRSTMVRSSNFHHSILVIETFLLSLLARRGYRMDERDLELTPINGINKDTSINTKLPNNYNSTTPISSNEITLNGDNETEAIGESNATAGGFVNPAADDETDLP